MFGEVIIFALLNHSGKYRYYERFYQAFRDAFGLLNLSYMRLALYTLTQRNSSSSSKSGTVKDSVFRMR
jgi:hypothetical protein